MAEAVERTLVIRVPGRPFSLNAERSRHWSERSERARDLRHAARISLLEAVPSRSGRPIFEAVGIEVHPWALNRRYRADVGNVYPAVKAVIDGFVDAHLIEDDDDTHLRWIAFYPHQFGVDQMEIVVHDLGAGAPVTSIAEARRRLHPVSGERG